MPKNKKLISVLISSLVILIITSYVFFKGEISNSQLIPTKLITSVHSDLPFKFETEEKNIFAYSILLFPVAVAPYYLEFLGIIYLLFSFPLSAYYIFICYKLLKTKDKKYEKSI